MEMSQSLFSWIHLSYCISGCAKRSGSSASQSLFSWIHLSYSHINDNRRIHVNLGLNPYFPGFIFLINSSDQTIACSGKSLNPYFPGFIFLINLQISHLP